MVIRPFTWLAFSFFGYFIVYGIAVPFLPVWLNHQSYDSELIGLVLASSYFFRFIGGIAIASRVNYARQLIPILRILAWLSMGLSLLMLISANYFWLLFILLALYSMVNSAGIPLTDTLANTWQKQISLDYGKARLIGSVAFTFSVVVFGNLIGWLGNQYIMVILTALLLLYSLLQMAKPSLPPTEVEPQQSQASASYLQLLANPTTLRLLIAACLIQGSHAGYYVYSVLYWTSNGISVGDTSLLWGLAVLAEILIFFFSGRLFKHWNIAHLFLLSAVACVIRWLVYANVTELWIIALLQTFHSLTFAVMHYAMVNYIASQPQQQMAKLQSLYNVLSNCVGIGIMTALSGIIYQSYSATSVFTAMAISATLAIFIIPRRIKGQVRQLTTEN